jgi:hypothetical protein
MWGFPPSIFELLQEYFRKFLEQNGADPKAECYIPSAVSAWILAGQAKVSVLHTSDLWFGVTYREDRPRVVENIRRLIGGGSYPERLWL